MLSALGATDRHVRLVMVANGALVGAAGALIGAVIGLGAWIAYAPHLAVSAHHELTWTHLPWWLVAATMLLAILTATLASRRPARAVAQVPTVAALSGRPPATRAVHRSADPGRRDPRDRHADARVLRWLGRQRRQGHAACNSRPPRNRGRPAAARPVRDIASGLPCPPSADRGPDRPPRSRPLPIPLRSRARREQLRRTHRDARHPHHHRPLRRPGGLLRTEPPRQPTSRPNRGYHAVRTPAHRRRRRRSAPPSRQPRPKRSPHHWTRTTFSPSTPPTRSSARHTATGDLGGPGTIYLATPALLAHYGIDSSSISPATMVITSRPGLQGTSGLELISGGIGTRPASAA